MRRKSGKKPDAGGKHRQAAATSAKPVAPRSSYQLKTPLLAISLVFLALVAFGGICTKDSQFLDWDDDQYVYANPHVGGQSGGLSLENVGWAFTAFHSHNWHPLTWLSLQLDHELYGLAAWGFHQTNVILHAATTLLLFLVLRWMTGAVWRSALVAALFAVHPLHVESVAWVSERKDVLSALFWMLTLAAYIWYAKKTTLPRFALVMLTFAFGLMAKPMLVTLPFVLLLLDYWPLQRCAVLPAGRLVLEKVRLVTMAAGCSILTVLAQEQLEQSLEVFPLHIRILNASLSYVRYLGKLCWPSNLAAFYPVPPAPWVIGLGIGSGIVLFIVSLLVVRQRRERPYLAVGWFWYLGTLVPVIGLLQVGTQAMADRYTYIPLIGIFLIIAWGGVELCARWKISLPLQAGIAAVALAVCLAVTWRQIIFWHNPILLWGHAVEVTSDNWPAHYNLGMALRQGGAAEEAMFHLRRAAQIQPRHVHSHYYLALTLLTMGKQEEAEEELEAAIAQAAIAHRPDFTLADFNLGQLQMQDGRLSEAAEHLQACLRFRADLVEPNQQLGMVRLFQGKYAEARQCFEVVLKAQPKHDEAHAGLGLLLALQGEWDQARPHLEQAADTLVEARFDLAWLLQERGNEEAKAEYRRAAEQDRTRTWPETAARQAWLLATNPDPNNRNHQLALQRATTACAATNYQEPAFLDALAAAQAASGRFTEATATLQKALDLAKGKDAAYRKRLEKRLELYQAGTAFREENAKQPTKNWRPNQAAEK